MTGGSVLKFLDSRSAQVVSIEPDDHLGRALEQIALVPPRPALVLVGGASGLSNADSERLRPFFVHGIAAIAQAYDLCVVDGGTDAGIMRLIAQAREEIGATFPLVGVCPVDRVSHSDFESLISRYALESRHSHFVLVPGASWVEGARWQARVASVLAGDAESITVLVNGGEVAWADVGASVEEKRKVVVVEGSGRTADAIVQALNGNSTDERAEGLIASGLIQAVNSIEDPTLFVQILEKIFS